MAVTKDDVARIIHKRLELNKAAAQATVDLILDVMKESLERGESVLINGFGSFDLREKKPRRGRNPQTGDDIVIEERRVVTFRLSKGLKERLNRGRACTTEDGR